LGNKAKALELFQQCVDVTPRMAYELIQVFIISTSECFSVSILKRLHWQALKRENVEYVVAPYEADAQLAYLEKSGRASAILTEDSDLLVFGCQRVHRHPLFI
jgi:exonuclease-1